MLIQLGDMKKMAKSLATFVILLLTISYASMPPAALEANALEAETTDLHSILLDDISTQTYIGTNWGDAAMVSRLSQDDREVLRFGNGSSSEGWTLMHTKAFRPESWENATALEAVVNASTSGLGLKIELRNRNFETIVADSICEDLPADSWSTCSWSFEPSADLSEITHLSFVLDGYGSQITYVDMDELRLVQDEAAYIWDDFSDSDRRWTPSKAYLRWNTGLPSHGGVTHHSQEDDWRTTLYLGWDTADPCCSSFATAELGTTFTNDIADWRDYNRLTAEVRCDIPNLPVNLFIWDTETANGFGTLSQILACNGEWETATWITPWSGIMDTTDIDEIKFVVNDLENFPKGELFIDNINLIQTPQPVALSGIQYILDNFDDHHWNDNDFNGNWGVLVETAIDLAFNDVIYQGDQEEGASLKINYQLGPNTDFTGIWMSLLGHSDHGDKHFLNFHDFFGNFQDENPRQIDQIHFYVRGSGETNNLHVVKVELKDTSKRFDRTAFRYITIDDAQTEWQQIVLDADVTNGDFWSYNDLPPDPTQMKELVFVVEPAFNDTTGTFYIDELVFVDQDEVEPDFETISDADLAKLISERTFLYFLDWYDPTTGLYQDKSVFPDLMSTAATGFGLTALVIGVEKGWIDRDEAITRVLKTLQTLKDKQSANTTVEEAKTGTNGIWGYFYHFLTDEGIRDRTNDPSELSTVDTAILMGGIITVRNYFADQPELVNLATELYEGVQWDKLYNEESQQFYLGWKPECSEGFMVPAPDGGCFSGSDANSPGFWNYYTDEVLLIAILAIASPTHPVEIEAFYSWERNTEKYGGKQAVNSWFGTYFTFVFAHLFIPFDELGADKHPTTPIDWHENSVEASKMQLIYTKNKCDQVPIAPFEAYCPYGVFASAAELSNGTYLELGAEPAGEENIREEGTAAPYSTGMACMFLPDECIQILRHFILTTDIWRHRFGFGDSFTRNPEAGELHWHKHSHILFGIDQGPMLIAMNVDIVHEYTRKDKDLETAFEKLFEGEIFCETIFLPLIATPPVIAPDLVAESITTVDGELKLTIKNNGNKNVDDTFWVDLFVDPTVIPTEVNDTLERLGQNGLVWDIAPDRLPLYPGESLILTLNDASFDDSHSHLYDDIPAGATLYAHVDSWNGMSTFGAIKETHEQFRGVYNNVLNEKAVSPISLPRFTPVQSRNSSSTEVIK